MKKLLFLIPLLALLGLGPLPIKSVKQLIDPEGVGRCSAWSYGKGIWITANHCVANPKLGLKAFKQDKVADLAAIRGEKAPGLPIAAVEPTYLDHVYTIGYPGGQSYFFAFPARVVGVTREKINMSEGEAQEMELIWAIDSGLSGMSGSPVLNDAGQVVGVLHAGGAQEGINFGGFTRLKLLREFLKGLK